MKKLMGISVIAALAVLPVAANAAEGDQVQRLSAAAVVSSQNLATTSYVQGAYKAAADKVDEFIDSTSIATNGNYIDAGKDVAHNLGELDTAAKANADNIGTLSGLTTTDKSNLVAAINEVKANSADAYQLKVDSAVSTAAEGTYTAIQAGQAVGDNLEALDSHVKTNEGAIALLNNSDATVAGSVKNSIKTQAKDADYTNVSMTGISSISGAIDNLDTRVDTAESNITTLNANSSTSGSVDYKVKNNAAAADYTNESMTGITSISGAIGNLDTRVDTLELSTGSLAADGHYILEENTVSQNLVALDDRVYTNAGAIATETSRAEGVEGTLTNLTTEAKTNLVAAINEVDAHADTNATNIATINNKQIPIVSDWSTGTVTQKKISELVAAAN